MMAGTSLVFWIVLSPAFTEGEPGAAITICRVPSGTAGSDSSGASVPCCSVATSGLVFYALSLCLPLDRFYAAFSLERTSYGALAVFGLWFGLVSFLLQPLTNALSRRHEFAADAFALRSGATAAELGEALRTLREKSRLLPLSHPLYSRVYHSHPPLIERLRVMGALETS